jgi:predicted RNA-binding Zn ribbon-like protein
MDRFDPGPQPAGRPPAPGRLGYVQAFLNSFWDLEHHGREVWDGPGGYGAWLRARGFAGHATAADVARAIDLREALRGIALANHDARGAAEGPALGVLDTAVARLGARAGLVPRFAGSKSRLEPAADGPDGALALALGIVFAARADGTWSRLKACPHADCGWAFYDHSRNRSGQWCSMRLCGNRTKGARFRDRHRG